MPSIVGEGGGVGGYQEHTDKCGGGEVNMFSRKGTVGYQRPRL